jgi:streptomycin 6-kinase
LTSLVVAGRDDEAMHQLTAVTLALHRSTHAPPGFPTVEEWGEGFVRYRRSGDGALSRVLVDRAAACFVALAESQTERRLLHGDLHHGNILWDDDRGWLAIDPKGVIGEAAYEFGAAMRNPTHDVSLFASSAIIDRRSRIIAEQTGIDQPLILQWAFAQAVLSAIWSIEDGVSPDHGVAAANAILTFL